jgi:hypothetical protein
MSNYSASIYDFNSHINSPTAVELPSTRPPSPTLNLTPPTTEHERIQEHFAQRRRAGEHAAMIVQAAEMFGETILVVIQAFAGRSPFLGGGPLPFIHAPVSPLLPSAVPSPEPIPIPPRRNDTPFPREEDIAQVPTPVSPLPLYSPVTPPPFYPSTPTPDLKLPPLPIQGGPQPGEYPGEGWIENYLNNRVGHRIFVPVGEEGVEIAPFIQYDFNTDSPELLTTRGRNFRVHSRPLHARPGPYPLPAPTRREQNLFHTRQPYTPLVDQALEIEHDNTLRAEVQRYQRKTKQAAEVALCLAMLRDKLMLIRQQARDSALCLGQADAFQRVLPRIVVDIPAEDLIPERIIVAGVSAAMNQHHNLVRRNDTGRWCHANNHDTVDCNNLHQCLLCTRWGHQEYSCYTTHDLCTEENPYCVPIDHRRARKPCRSRAYTFGCQG